MTDAPFASPAVERRLVVHRRRDPFAGRAVGADLALPERGAALQPVHQELGRVGRGVVALLPLTGVASMRHIAEILELPAETFAALWNELPLEDVVIGEHLGVTRQQVVNLRKCARQRLARRMRGF